MFEQPLYIQNSFQLSFDRQITIRQHANQFEELLGDRYDPPLVLPIANNIDPESPRIVFGSQNGFSQIVISQVALSLVVRYSPDYQQDMRLRRNYLAPRVQVLFDLLAAINVVPTYCGFGTLVQLPSQSSDQEIVHYLIDRFMTNLDNSLVYDVQFKVTDLLSNRFFSNVAVENYRQWEAEGVVLPTTRLSTAKAVGRGVQFTADFNDRYAYSEQPDYYTDRSVTDAILDGGFEAVDRMISKVQGRGA